MSPGGVLQLATLPTLHPKTQILLAFGTSTIVRLSLDPTGLPSGTMVRAIAVEWSARTGGAGVQKLSRDIGWSGVPNLILDGCETWAETRNAPDITEEAAIGVMALLLPELEGAEILHVLQIGSGGDYLLGIQGLVSMQAESSGVYEDPKGYESTQRLKVKTEQVLKKCDTGFASVVAFNHSSTRDVCCKLHFVTRSGPTGAKASSKKTPRSRKKKRK